MDEHKLMTAPTLLDLVEEPLDQVAVAVEIGAEADRVLAIACGRDVRPRAPFVDKCPDPVRVVAAICQQSRAPRELSQQTEQSRLSCA